MGAKISIKISKDEIEQRCIVFSAQSKDNRSTNLHLLIPNKKGGTHVPPFWLSALICPDYL
jgi:hypothetical protein